MFSPIIVPPAIDEDEEDVATNELFTFLNGLSSDEETDLPLLHPRVHIPSERPLVPYRYLRRQTSRHENIVPDIQGARSPLNVTEFP